MCVVCFKHPNYDGSNPPILSCSNCCSIYVEKILNIRAAREFTVENFIKEKEDRQMARELENITRFI